MAENTVLTESGTDVTPSNMSEVYSDVRLARSETDLKAALGKLDPNYNPQWQNTEDDNTMLHALASNRHLSSKVKMTHTLPLIKAGMDPRVKNGAGKTAVQIADKTDVNFANFLQKAALLLTAPQQKAAKAGTDAENAQRVGAFAHNAKTAPTTPTVIDANIQHAIQVH